MADLFHLIYSSTPFGYDPADLNGILLTARRNNARHGITGALVCRHDVYLQYLEGPMAAVEALFEKIARDDRHVDILIRAKGAAQERLFSDWAMLHDPEHSLIWSVTDVDQGVMDDAPSLAFLATFQSVAAKVRAA